MKIAQLQTTVTDDKLANIDRVRESWEEIQNEKPDIVCLPEMFNCPYQTTKFPEYAEEEKGQSWQALSEFAAAYNIYLIGGSIPEVENGKVYNTCYVFDRSGRQIGKHRKMHLFDIDIKGGQRFKESDTLTQGNQITVIDTEFGKIGVAICYDIRFPELIRLMALQGAKWIFIPAAFNMTTGPAHWELLFRSRALDNQVFMFGTSSARSPEADYQAYGHSIAVSPWGDVIKQLDEKPGVMINQMDNNRIQEIRDQLPLLKHRREDIYDLSARDRSK